jgi:transport inhibitor response 1
VTLNFSCLEGDVNIIVLERLVTRCHNLKTLKLNNSIPLDKLAGLLHKAPQIEELGTGRFSADYHPNLFAKLEAAFAGCKSLRRLSGAWDSVRDYLPAFYCVCEGLTSLNLSYATIRGPELIKFISRCKNLQLLWVCTSYPNFWVHVLSVSLASIFSYIFNFHRVNVPVEMVLCFLVLQCAWHTLYVGCVI